MTPSLAKRLVLAFSAVALLGALSGLSLPAHAADADAGKDKKENRVAHPEDDDYTTTPYTQFGEFNEDTEEEADARFYAFGRFFGVSVGAGYQGVTGNRALLWQGGFPVFELKVHYWFDFNLAMDLGFYTTSHFFEASDGMGGHFDVAFKRIGMNLKYYFDTQNAGSAITFASPYVTLGIGQFFKDQTSAKVTTTDTDNSLGYSFGGGLEFVMSPRRSYFTIEAKVHLVNFKDTYSSTYKSITGANDLTGALYSTTASILFTW